MKITERQATAYRVDGKDFPSMALAQAHVDRKEWEVFEDSVFSDTEFTVHPDHLALMRASSIGWQNCEFGAAGIDCKRPYGNSGDNEILRAIAEACGQTLDDRDDWGNKSPSKEQKRFLFRRHWEMQHFMEILFQFGEIPAGTYTRKAAYYEWEKPSVERQESSLTTPPIAGVQVENPGSSEDKG